MCTSLALTSQSLYFGRNLDLNLDFNQQVVIVPRNFTLSFKHIPAQNTHYAMIGMASVHNGYPLYAEAINEMGLGCAGLNFNEYAVYKEHPTSKATNIAPYELIPWILACCKNVNEARSMLQNVRLVNTCLTPNMPCAPLHWMLSDAEHTLVIEQTREGFTLTDNPAHVLTNNPTIQFHLDSLRNYANISCNAHVGTFGEALGMKPFGVGMGNNGLPGGSSPNDRFVRAAWMRSQSTCSSDEQSCVSQFFHILDAVAMIQGCVKNPDGGWDITRYSCCMSAKTQTYYYKTYNHYNVIAIPLQQESLDGSELICKGYIG